MSSGGQLTASMRRGSEEWKSHLNVGLSAAMPNWLNDMGNTTYLESECRQTRHGEVASFNLQESAIKKVPLKLDQELWRRQSLGATTMFPRGIITVALVSEIKVAAK